jgi:hypothetical protein
MVCWETGEETISWRSKAGWTRGSYWKKIESETENMVVEMAIEVVETHADNTTILNVALKLSRAGRDGGDTTGTVDRRHVFVDCWREKREQERIEREMGGRKRGEY